MGLCSKDLSLFNLKFYNILVVDMEPGPSVPGVSFLPCLLDILFETDLMTWKAAETFRGSRTADKNLQGSRCGQDVWFPCLSSEGWFSSFGRDGVLY